MESRIAAVRGHVFRLPLPYRDTRPPTLARHLRCARIGSRAPRLLKAATAKPRSTSSLANSIKSRTAPLGCTPSPSSGAHQRIWPICSSPMAARSVAASNRRASATRTRGHPRRIHRHPLPDRFSTATGVGTPAALVPPPARQGCRRLVRAAEHGAYDLHEQCGVLCERLRQAPRSALPVVEDREVDPLVLREGHGRDACSFESIEQLRQHVAEHRHHVAGGRRLGLGSGVEGVEDDLRVEFVVPCSTSPPTRSSASYGRPDSVSSHAAYQASAPDGKP